jgi:hypothetical protein
LIKNTKYFCKKQELFGNLVPPYFKKFIAIEPIFGRVEESFNEKVILIKQITFR